MADKFDEARKLRNKARLERAAGNRVEYNRSNPKPTMKPSYRFSEPEKGAPEGGKTSRPMKVEAKLARQKNLHQRGYAAERGWKASQLTEGDPKYQGRRLTSQPKVITPRGFHEIGVKLERASTAPKPVAVSKGPGLVSRAASKVANYVKTGVANNRAAMTAARETAKAARWFNVAAKSAPFRAGLGITTKVASKLAVPLAIAEAGHSVYRAGESLAGARSAASDFDQQAKAARSRGIKSSRATGALAYLSGDPDIKVKVPNPPAAMKEAAKKIPKNVTGRKSFK